MTSRGRTPALVGLIGAASLALVGCGSATPDSGSAATVAPSSGDVITVKNCDKDVTVDKPVTKLFVNDGNIISIALAAGAHDQITAVSSLGRDKDVIALKYGDDQVSDLNTVADKYMTLENIIAAQPEMVFAGWNYGFTESKNLTPDVLKGNGIKSYLLSETCRQDDGARGTMDPWVALTTDIANMGILTGHRATADKVVEDIEQRKTALEKAPQPDSKPKVFLFDSGTDAILSCGRFGGPQAIFSAAGAESATADVEDTWVKVSWERLAAADPQVIFFVDYPGQSYEEKVQALEKNPASNKLTAVKEKRYVNLPYALWTSSPMNIDAAEYVRKALEHYKLAPTSDIKLQLDLTKLDDLPGNEWLKKP